MRKEIKTPQDGICVTLDKVECEAALCAKGCGGVAVIPNEGRITSPCSGTIIKVADTENAYNIMCDDGVEIVVQIGIKTGELEGRGFECKVSEGDRVKTGDLLCNADLAFISDSGYDIAVQIIIISTDKVYEVKIHEGEAKSPTSTVIEYMTKE